MRGIKQHPYTAFAVCRCEADVVDVFITYIGRSGVAVHVLGWHFSEIEIALCTIFGGFARGFLGCRNEREHIILIFSVPADSAPKAEGVGTCMGVGGVDIYIGNVFKILKRSADFVHRARIKRHTVDSD